MSEPAIRLAGVSFRYQQQAVIRNVSLTVDEGEFLAVVGPNGGGKTTLLKLLLGLEKPQQGTVRIFGRDPRDVYRRMGYVPQLSRLPGDFPISVEDVVMMGRLRGTHLGWRLPGYDREAVRRAMAAVEIADLSRRRMDSLSGGQHQRVMIARALAGEPKLLLLDEPTASVDSRMEQGIFELLQQLNRDATIVLVTHDLGFISRYVRRIACLNGELVCHHTGEITADILEKLYGTEVKMIRHQCEL